MEGYGVFPEFFFNSSEETEAMAQLLDAQIYGFKQIQDLNSLSDPNAMNYAMREEEIFLADSFLQIDSNYQFESLICLNEANGDEFTEFDSVILQKKRKFQAEEQSESSKKRVRNLGRKKGKGGVNGGEEEKNVGLSTSSCGYEDDDYNEVYVKGRSGRGVANDSQSLYAKKRRERINERLKILQNLVPNGTKVDISTMLEEAVQYVKFLQLQIKLLSSDELWMYAPLAYNGMNIGINLMMP